jgi:hypothetical protein
MDSASITHTSRGDGPSRCSMSRPSPRPTRTVSHLADARHRAGDEPGLTDLLSLIRQRERGRRDCDCRRLFCLRRFVDEVSNAIPGPLLLSRRPESPVPNLGRLRRISMSRRARNGPSAVRFPRRADSLPASGRGPFAERGRAENDAQPFAPQRMLNGVHHLSSRL